MNSAAVRRPDLIREAAGTFGSQCVVVAMDVTAGAAVRVASATKATDLEAVAWARNAAALGAGELLVTAIDRDGTQLGYDVDLTRRIVDAVAVPVIASGGAASAASFADLFMESDADAALAASLFHDAATSVGALKRYLAERGIEVRR